MLVTYQCLFLPITEIKISLTLVRVQSAQVPHLYRICPCLRACWGVPDLYTQHLV